MTISWYPVIFLDIIGSLLILGVAIWGVILSRDWKRKKPEDIFRHYIFLLTLAVVCFAVSRSFGHLAKQILIMAHMGDIWKQIAPFSGAINSMAFVIIFAFGIFFHHLQQVHVKIENYKINLEKMIAARTKELEETNLRLHNVLNSSNPICFTSVDYEVLQANNAFHSLWPKGKKLPKSVKCYELRPSRFCHTDECPLHQIMQGKEESTCETPEEIDGRIKTFIVTARPFRDNKGRLLGIVESFQDITERKKLEEQLRQSQKLEAIGQLAGGVAHDFNNMLGVIIGHADLALGKPTLDDALRENLEEILTAGFRSMEITQQLLAFARKQTIMPKVLDLNKSIDGMLKLLRRLIGEDIEITWLPGKDLWSVKMDPSQIDQILANLCINAKDASADKITIETQNITLDDAYCAEHNESLPGEYVMLAVSDNGYGMDKKTLDNIFEPFFTSKGLGKGTGLGLATVYGIVKQNAGFINVYSEPKQGSTFKIYLPHHTVKTEHPIEKSPLRPPPQGHETILLIEDDSEFLQMMKLMLEELGYTVLASSTQKGAIHIATEKSDDFDLLISDVIMPETTGKDLLKKLKCLCPAAKSLFMSGYTGNVIAHQGILEENVNFIQKPFSKQQLAIKVREVLDSK